MGCVIEHVPDGVRLTGASRDHMMAAAITCRTFRPPFTIKTVAKTDSTNLRLYWHVGEVIFNWECSIRRLKVHDPATGQWWDAEDEGFIEVDKWHEIAWEIKPNSMRVLVDGKARFERVGEWANIDAPVATAGGWDPVGSIQRAGESPSRGSDRVKALANGRRAPRSVELALGVVEFGGASGGEMVGVTELDRVCDGLPALQESG